MTSIEGTDPRDALRALAELRRQRDGFLHQRSVEISAFEARTEEEDSRLWADARQAADVLWPEATDAAYIAAASPDVILGLLDELQRLREPDGFTCYWVSADLCSRCLFGEDDEPGGGWQG